MKRLIPFFLLLLIAPACAAASSISRSLPSGPYAPGQDVPVTLQISLTSGESYYLIDDVVPAGWTVTNPGLGDSSDPGHVKWVVIQGAADTAYTYEVRAPQAAGTYSFYGKFMLEGMTSEQSIQGASTASVAGASQISSHQDKPYYFQQVAIVPLIIIAGLIISLAVFIVKSRNAKAIFEEKDIQPAPEKSQRPNSRKKRKAKKNA